MIYLINTTKRMFADALIELLKTMPIQKITVKGIADYCDTRRPTFYYHFKDKYDLVTWIYRSQADAIANNMCMSSWKEIACSILEYVEKNKKFYANAFNDDGQNSLTGYLFDYDVELLSRILKERSLIDPNDDEVMFAIRYHSFACVSMTKEWILKRDHETPKEYSEKMYQTMPELLRTLLPSENKIIV